MLSIISPTSSTVSALKLPLEGSEPSATEEPSKPLKKVLLKMDVNYSDHSHIIGRSGTSIKQVMNSTKCHIHFPDCNKGSTNEKSNQVTIAGEMPNIELARASVRKLMPVIFHVEMNYDVRDLLTLIKQLQNKFNLQVYFRQNTVSIKGSCWELDIIKKASDTFLGWLANMGKVPQMTYMVVEVSVQHHLWVCGDQNANLHSIMKRTNTVVTPPNSNDTNLHPLRKTTFLIRGCIQNTFQATQYFMGMLPITLSFDINQMTDLDPTLVENIMTSYDVVILTKPKPRIGVKSVLIKGYESNAGNVYAARRRLLRLDEEPFEVDFPENFKLPDVRPFYRKNYISYRFKNPCQWSCHSVPFHWKSPDTQLCGNFISPSMMGCVHQAPLLAHPALDTGRSYRTGFYDGATLPIWRAPSPLRIGARFCPSSEESADRPVRAGSPICSRDGEPKPDSRGGSTSPLDPEDVGLSKLCSNFSRLEDLFSMLPDRRAPGCEMSALTQLDLHQRKLLSCKTMSRIPNGEVEKVPDSSWSGLSCSKSASLVQQERKARSESHPKLQMNLSCLSDYWKPGPLSGEQCDSDYASQDLATLLANANLSKYIDVFQTQEVDMSMFVTLNERDLQDLGITAFGSRRKMLCLIHECRKKLERSF